jgi:capsular polysaccharide biosynthesis protein
LIQLSGRQFDRLLINGSGADYERDSLNAMKIAREKIVYVDGRDRFEIEQAIVPSMDHTSQTVAPWKVEVLRKLDDTIPANPNTPRRIYVSRRHAAVRRVINETEFEEALKAANFAIVELESMAWQRQVSLFRAAEVILAPHGAALANIAFAQLGTRVAEIGTRAGYKDFYLQLAAAAGLEYQLIEAQPRTASRRESLRPSENEDMAVEIATIRQFLKSL